MAEILPDSRLRQESAGKGAVHDAAHGWLVPIYCASCHVEGGLVPEQLTSWAFWICRDCEHKYGRETVGMVIPDEVVYAAIKEEQVERFGRLLTPEEIRHVVDTSKNPLTTLLTKGLK